MPQLFVNNARSTLAGSITNVATTLAVQAPDAAKFPTPGAGDYFLATLVDGSLNREIVKVTARVGTTLTIVRGQEGTTPFAFASGSNIDCRLTAGTLALFTLGPTGPVVDNAAARMDGPAGNQVQSSPLIIEDNGDTHPETNDVGALGTDAKRWGDLKLAIGAKINLGGDVEITHSTAALAWTGATNGYSFDNKLKLPTGLALDFGAGDYAITHAAGTLTFSGAIIVAGGTQALPGFRFTATNTGLRKGTNADELVFVSSANDKGSFHSSGFTVTDGTPGLLISADGSVAGASMSTVGQYSCYVVNDLCAQFGRSNSGVLLNFHTAGSSKGTISESGGTVAYNPFFGSHYSQMASDAADVEMLVGTIVDSVDELSDIPEIGKRLPRYKVSDTPGSKAVYGVFHCRRAEEGYDEIGSLGAYFIRIAAGRRVQRGDLIESNGNGCGKIQSDDIMRACTVGKVTSAAVVETYPDGSYLVPCTLHCG